MNTKNYTFSVKEKQDEFIAILLEVGITHIVLEHIVTCTFKYKTIEILTDAYYSKLIN